jgi:hypothetical protein
MTTWPQTLLDGAVWGAFGVIGPFSAAVWVVKRQSQADRELFETRLREQRHEVSNQAVLSAQEHLLLAYGAADVRVMLDHCANVVRRSVSWMQAVHRWSPSDAQKMADAFNDLRMGFEDLRRRQDSATSDELKQCVLACYQALTPLLLGTFDVYLAATTAAATPPPKPQADGS